MLSAIISKIMPAIVRYEWFPQSGKLRQGCLKTSRNNFLEANVLVEGMERAVLIQGRLNINRALNDDTVAVELLPEDQWCRPTNVIIDQEKEEEDNKGIGKYIVVFYCRQIFTNYALNPLVYFSPC